jgi:hypothetical protein
MYQGGKAVTFAQEIAEKGWVHTIDHAGFKASLMKADRLEDRGSTHGLPPGDRIPVFPIATLPGAPKEWVREAGTYVVPVDTNWGLWFDWTMNDKLNTAVLSSVKGMDPITGRKLEGFNLEQYADKCPKHDKPFSHGRYCEECEYEWPPQNYVCYPNTLWWDGFRQPDGSVRQFFFSDEDKRDIASLVIGKQNVVPAFGFAFFQPKENRVPPRPVVRSRGVGGQSVGGSVHHLWGGPTYESSGLENMEFCDSLDELTPGDSGEAAAYDDCAGCDQGSTTPRSFTAHIAAQAMNMSVQSKGVSGQIGPNGPTGHLDAKGPVGKLKAAVVKEKRSKSVSVGAGAKIRQSLAACTLGVDGWKPEPAAFVRLYFCFEEQFRSIAAKGIKSLVSDSEGYLKDLPVG